jgi:hypothetical protein
MLGSHCHVYFFQSSVLHVQPQNSRIYIKEIVFNQYYNWRVQTCQYSGNSVRETVYTVVKSSNLLVYAR